MGVINIVKNAKEIHPEFVLIIRIGKFYYTYGKDSYIISYLCNYKLGKFQEMFDNRIIYIKNIKFNMLITQKC